MPDLTVDPVPINVLRARYYSVPLLEKK
jgi:hypothetical protein